MSLVKTNAILDASGGTTATINGYTPTMSNMAGRNRIINGAMVIDQRNAGASVTGSTSDPYVVDRWLTPATQNSKFTFQQNAGSVTPPSGFVNYFGATSSSSYSVGANDLFTIAQRIEGYNAADLRWGTASAKAVTLSFWVRSSLTGTFGGALQNSGASRSYPFTYTISAANTWEYKTVTIPGDQSGTWLTTNGIGIIVNFGLGAGSAYSGSAGSWYGGYYSSATGATSVVGTSGATFYITGVQLEEGSVATPFERRDYGRELMMCQRYYCSSFDSGVAPANGLNYELGAVYTNAVTYSTANGYCPTITLPVFMRTPPTIALLSTNLAPTNGQWAWYNGAFTAAGSTQAQGISNNYFGVSIGSGSSFPLANGGVIVLGAWTASAEL